MKEHKQMDGEFPKWISNEKALWRIADEYKRRNDLLEVEMLCRTADALRTAAKSSSGSLHVDGWGMAEKLALMANKRLTSALARPSAPTKVSIDEVSTSHGAEYGILFEGDGEVFTVAKCWDKSLAEDIKRVVAEHMGDSGKDSNG